jgi:AcrR family transcriptional regulator
MGRKAEVTRQRILDAALEEFSSKGFHGARVDSIASGAGINKERIYAYFGNKEKLFSLILRQCFESLFAAEQGLLQLDGSDPARLPRAILDLYIRFHEEHPHFWRILAWENLEGGRHVKSFAGVRDPVLDHLKRLYRRGQRSEVFNKKVSFEAFIFQLWAAVFFYYSNRRTISSSLNIDMFDQKVRNMLMREVLENIQKGSTS